MGAGIKTPLAAELSRPPSSTHAVPRYFLITGINSETIVKPASISEEELLNLINKLNNDENVDGLLVQLPLPGESWSSPVPLIPEQRGTSLLSTPDPSAGFAERQDKLKSCSVLVEMGQTSSDYLFTLGLILRSEFKGQWRAAVEEDIGFDTGIGLCLM